MICTHYENRTRCKTEAVAWIYAPNWHRVPGAATCWEHGEAELVEYQTKLGQTWHALALTDVDRCMPLFINEPRVRCDFSDQS